MKLHISLTANRIDPESVQGEEFDEAIVQAVEDIDIDGWEMTKVDVSREKPSTIGPHEVIAQSLQALAMPGGEGWTAAQLDDPYPSNPKYTWRQMLAYWAQELSRSKPKKQT